MMNEEHQRMLAPKPTNHYPAPWRVAEDRGEHVVVVCDAGHYTAEAPTAAAADLIVTAVNHYAGCDGGPQARGTNPVTSWLRRTAELDLGMELDENSVSSVMTVLHEIDRRLAGKVAAPTPMR